MKKLIDYSGIENIKYFFMKLITMGGITLISGIFGLSMVIIKSTALCASLCVGIGIGIIIGFIGYLTWRYLADQKQKETLERNQEILENFLKKYKLLKR